jgi:hypothetical protein
MLIASGTDRRISLTTSRQLQRAAPLDARRFDFPPMTGLEDGNVLLTGHSPMSHSWHISSKNLRLGIDDSPEVGSSIRVDHNEETQVFKMT